MNDNAMTPALISATARTATVLAAAGLLAGVLAGCGGSHAQAQATVTATPVTVNETQTQTQTRAPKTETVTVTGAPTTVTVTPAGTFMRAPRREASPAPRGSATAEAAPYVHADPVPAPQFYKNCTAARAAGVTPLYRGQPGYASHLDRDNDGIACE